MSCWYYNALTGKGHLLRGRHQAEKEWLSRAQIEAYHLEDQTPSWLVRSTEWDSMFFQWISLGMEEGPRPAPASRLRKGSSARPFRADSPAPPSGACVCSVPVLGGRDVCRGEERSDRCESPAPPQKLGPGLLQRHEGLGGRVW